MAVAVAKHILNKFVQVATEEGGELYLDQLPQVACGQLENQRSFQRSVKSGTAPELSPPLNSYIQSASFVAQKTLILLQKLWAIRNCPLRCRLGNT